MNSYIAEIHTDKMYSYENETFEWPQIRYREESSSPDYDVIRTVVTAVVEPVPEEKLHTSYKHVETKAHKKNINRNYAVDYDAIEVCSPSPYTNQKCAEALKRTISVSRTLLQLSGNADSKINKQQEPVNTIRNNNKSKLTVDKISQLERNEPTKKRNHIRTIEQENLLEFKQLPSKRPKTTKAQKMQNLKPPKRSERLLIQSKNLCSHTPKLLNKNKLSELKIGDTQQLTDSIDISSASVNFENKNIPSTSSSANSSKSTVLIPIQEMSKEPTDKYSIANRKTIENLLDKTQPHSLRSVEYDKSLNRSVLLKDSLIDSQNIAAVLFRLGEATLLSLAGDVTLLVGIIKKSPNNPSLHNLYNVLQQLNGKLSTYFKT